MTSFEKKFTASILLIGFSSAIIGYFNASSFGIVILLACLLYAVYVYFSSNGEDK
tara:strand:+ start:819 stop:983 length:165 start_codon:yes stop_codon:yes gene_type:complete